MRRRKFIEYDKHKQNMEERKSANKDKLKKKYFFFSFPDDITLKWKKNKSKEKVEENPAFTSKAKVNQAIDEEKGTIPSKREEVYRIIKKPKVDSKMSIFRKFENIETYAALCRIGSSVVDKKSGIELNENVAKHIAREFEIRIKEQAKTCSPKHASNWIDALSFSPFNKHVNWESIINEYKDRIKDAIRSSTQSQSNERLALDWLKFAGRWANDSKYYSGCISQCAEGVNGKEVSPMIAKEICTILKSFNNGETKIYDALTGLQIPQQLTIWEIESFRQAAWACLTMETVPNNLIRECMCEIKKLIIEYHDLFETWGNVYTELNELGVELY